MSTADDLIRALGEMAHRTQRESDELREAIKANATTVRHDWLTLSLAGGQIQELTFTDKGADASHVQLRNAILSTWRQAQGRSTGSLAADVERITGSADGAQAIRDTLPQSWSDTDDDETAPAQRQGAQRDPGDVAAGEEAVARFHEAQRRGEQLGARGPVDASLETMFADEPAYLNEVAQRREPINWRKEFENAIAEAIREGRKEAERMQVAEGQADSKMFRITAQGLGGLVDVTILPGARGRDAKALSEDFMATYRKACAQAFQGGDLDDVASLFTPGS